MGYVNILLNTPESQQAISLSPALTSKNTSLILSQKLSPNYAKGLSKTKMELIQEISIKRISTLSFEHCEGRGTDSKASNSINKKHKSINLEHVQNIIKWL